MSPDGIAITPDGKTAYTTDNGFGKVTPIDLDAGIADPSLNKDSPIGIVITRDGRTAYIANYSAGTVTPIGLPSGISGTPIKVGNVPDSDRDHPGRQDRLRRQQRGQHGYPDPPPGLAVQGPVGVAMRSFTEMTPLQPSKHSPVA
jgi:hypothetical protein